MNTQMQKQVIKECLEISIMTLKYCYQPDTAEECKENIKNFLEDLHDNEDSNQEMRDFVYNAIKNFAEDKQRLYQQSNLI